MSHTQSHVHGYEELELNLPTIPFCWICIVLDDRKRIKELEAELLAARGEARNAERFLEGLKQAEDQIRRERNTLTVLLGRI